MSKIAILIDSKIIGELFLRTGPDQDVSGWVETIVEDYLDRTAHDQWSEAYYAYRESQADANLFIEQYGDPKGGYHWAPLFLPNGTLIRMEYKKDVFQSAVKHNKIEFNGQSYSPSELASAIAGGTRRNAWRDLMIKRPGQDKDWCLADDLRRRLLK